MINLANELSFAKNIAVTAGQVIMTFYSEVTEVRYKEDHSPLTLADQEANNLIAGAIIKNYPKHALLAEESQDSLARLNNEWCWIVDPLDGTKEFIKKNGEFTVNIALVYRQRPVMGVIYAPARGELYFAASGCGAYRQKNGSAAEKISVSPRTDNLRLLMSRSHPSEALNNLIKINDIQETTAIGSSLKGCLIACGAAEVYYRLNPTREWDIAAMHCIVEEAGGIFHQIDDSDMLYNRPDTLNNKGFYFINLPENKLKLTV